MTRLHPIKAALAALALIAVALPAAADPLKQGTGLVFVPGMAFTLTAPEGWLMDNETGMEQGLQSVFYPQDQTWAGSPVVAYAHAAIKRAPGIHPDDMATQKVTKMRGHGNAGMTAHPQAPVALADGEAQVYYFDGYQKPYFEAVAYVDGPRAIATLAFGARTHEDFDTYLPAFNALVKSYHDVSDAPAVVDADGFAALKKEASTLAATDKGKAYEARLIGHFTPALRSYMTGCMIQMDPEDIRDFEMVFEVDQQGGVHDTHVLPYSALAICFERLARGAHHPAHGFDHYIQHISMHIPK